jgi:hypothetical protein
MDLRKCDISALIRCEDEECGGVTFRHEFEQNNWHCPFCGKSISKSEGHPNLPHYSLLARGLRVPGGIGRSKFRRD